MGRAAVCGAGAIRQPIVDRGAGPALHSHQRNQRRDAGGTADGAPAPAAVVLSRGAVVV